MKTEILDIIQGMDVPEYRKEDVGWLLRNLGIRNSKHPNFQIAIDELKKISLHNSKNVKKD